MADRADLEKRLSGGAGNSDPTASLGGVMSSTTIVGQTATDLSSNITGVTMVEARGHDSPNFGTGSLFFDAGLTQLFWTPNAGSQGAGVDVSVDGRYVVAASDPDLTLVVDVVSASLPGVNATSSIDVQPNLNALWPNVTGSEAELGVTKYRCYYMTNVNGTDNIANVRLHLDGVSTAPSGAQFAFGLDPAGIGDGSSTGVATTIVDENTAPAGVTFSSPTDLGSAVTVGDLTPGDAQAVWVRQVVPPDTPDPIVVENIRILHVVRFP